MKTRQINIGTYLAVGIGMGCAASSANGAVVFYQNLDGTDNMVNDPSGLGLYFEDGYAGLESYGSNAIEFNRGSTSQASGRSFSSVENISIGTGISSVEYGYDGYGYNGATLGSDQNFAMINFNPDEDSEYEAVAQFFFDGNGGGYLIAVATLNAIDEGSTGDLSEIGGDDLSIEDGRDLILNAAGVSDFEAAAIPEPSSIALLALGATGLMSRRQRKRA